MVANRAFQAPFTVEKKYWRTDPYDNQLGEIETAERGLMYEEFERRKEALMCEEIEENWLKCRHIHENMQQLFQVGIFGTENTII